MRIGTVKTECDDVTFCLQYYFKGKAFVNDALFFELLHHLLHKFKGQYISSIHNCHITPQICKAEEISRCI